MQGLDSRYASLGLATLASANLMRYAMTRRAVFPELWVDVVFGLGMGVALALFYAAFRRHRQRSKPDNAP